MAALATTERSKLENLGLKLQIWYKYNRYQLHYPLSNY